MPFFNLRLEVRLEIYEYATQKTNRFISVASRTEQLETWGVTPKNFLDIETFILAINHGSHWMVVIICPSRRTVAYVDSFRSSGPTHLPTAWNFLRDFLGARSKASEWKTITYNVCTPYIARLTQFSRQ